MTDTPNRTHPGHNTVYIAPYCDVIMVLVIMRTHKISDSKKYKMKHVQRAI